MAMEMQRRAVYFAPEMNSEAVEPPQNEPRNLCKVAMSLIISIVTHVLDVVSDVSLAIGYAAKGEIFKSVATLSVVYFSSLATTYISVAWYRMVNRRSKTIQHADYEEVLPDLQISDSFHSRAVTTKNCCLFSFYILLLFILQAGPLISMLIALQMVWRQMRSAKTHQRENPGVQNEVQLHECDQVLNMINMHSSYEEMYECFLEAIPQSLLQISLLINDVIEAQGHFFSDFLSYWRVVTILLSVLKIKKAVWSYNSLVTTSTFLVGGVALADVRNGALFALKASWHLLIAVSQVMALCYVAARYSHVAAGTMILLFWLLMLLWLRDDFKGWKRTENVVMYLADAWIFVWVPFSSKIARNVSFYVLYYFLQIVECGSILAICLLTEKHALPIGICVGALVILLLGLTCKIAYFLNITRRPGHQVNKTQETLS